MGEPEGFFNIQWDHNGDGAKELPQNLGRWVEP